MRIIQLIFVRLFTYVVTEYTHDMQGRLTKINDPDNPAGAPFCMELQYQDPDIAGATARYTAGASATRWIHYSRLISGVHSGSNNEQAISYDSNGNVTTDGIRGMNIDYNYLDLPVTVTKGQDTLKYIYDAQGTKLATAINDTIINYYTGMVVYRDDKSMDYIINSTGMIRKQGQQYVRQYNITDHLGSTRAVVDQSANVIQATDYYPYGLPFQYNSLEKNRYLYNNKEIQNQSLGSVFLGTYDYGARFYDPELGRWHSVDPLASDFPSWTPYHFVHNNPIVLIDPTGMSADWFQNEETGDIYYNSELKKGDESQLGENWSHLGENGMFSDGTPMTNDVALLAQNKSLTNLEQNADGSISAEGYMKSDKAEDFMDKQGYDLVPTQQTIYESESSSYFPTSPGKGITIISGAETRITEKVGYIKSGNMEIGKTQIDDVLSKYNVLSLSKVSRYQINYTDNGWKKFTTRTINLSKPLSGTHDYRMKRTYKNWNQYPGNNSLINKFKKEYGTK